MDYRSVDYIDEGVITDWVGEDFLFARALLGTSYATADPSVVALISTAVKQLETMGIFIRTAEVVVEFPPDRICQSKSGNDYVYRPIYPMTHLANNMLMDSGGAVGIQRFDGGRFYLNYRTQNRSISYYSEELCTIRLRCGYPKGEVDDRVKLLLGSMFNTLYKERDAYQDGAQKVVQNAAFNQVFESIIQDNGGINNSSVIRIAPNE